MISRAVLCALVIGTLVGAPLDLAAQQPGERPFQALGDGSYQFRTGGSSTISVGPMPASLAGRGPLFLVSGLETVRISGYPAMLRDGGIGGAVVVGLYVHWSGQVHQTRIDESSGVEGLDQAALLVASVIGFQQVPAGSPLTFDWVSIPIRFQVG